MGDSKWLSTAKNLCVFALGRYPFVNALLLMMILGERATADKGIPPIKAELIYAYIVIMVLLGVGMSYDLRRLLSAFGFVLQLAVLGTVLYTNEHLGYKPWLRNRLIVRCLGLSGVYTIYGFLMSAKKSKRLQKIGEGLLAVFTMTSMFILVNSHEDRDLFENRIPLKSVSLYFLITVMGACAMIYINGGLFVTDASQAMMCINLALLLTINADVNFWVKKRGVPFWVQTKIICDDLSICIGLFLMAFAKIYWKKRLPKEDKYGNLYHHE